jgi:hypothetical protein
MEYATECCEGCSGHRQDAKFIIGRKQCFIDMLIAGRLTRPDKWLASGLVLATCGSGRG